jgi:hypothetical protein
VISDPHFNSSVAVCPPVFELSDRDSHRASPVQRWIHDHWLEFCDIAVAKPNPVILWTGDTVDGDYKNRTYQIISRNPRDIKLGFAELVKPLKNLKMLFTKGTPAHVGRSGEMETQIADDLKSPIQDAWYLDVEGVRMEIAHHSSVGGLPWTRPNAIIRYAAKALFSYAERGEKPPDIIIRGHVHKWADSEHAYRAVRALIAPAWTAGGEYSEGKYPGDMADIGSYFIECDGGKYEVSRYNVPMRRRIWVKI